MGFEISLKICVDSCTIFSQILSVEVLRCLRSKFGSDFRLQFAIIFVGNLMAWVVVEIAAYWVRWTWSESAVFLWSKSERSRVVCKILPWYIIVNGSWSSGIGVLINSIWIGCVYAA